MSEKIIIFYPNERILEALQADSLSFVSIDENLCISNFEKGIFQTRQTLSDIECNPFSISEIENFYAKIDYYSPIFARWEHKGYEHELLKEEILIKIMRLSKLITDLKITKAVMLTGSSHHLDTYTFELALSYKKIPQIFLYAENVTGRLLPVKQLQGVKDRSPLRLKISDFTYENVIDRVLLSNYILPKMSNTMRLVNVLKQSFLFNIIYLILRKIRQLFRRRWFSLVWSDHKYNFSNRIGETLFSDLDLIRTQYQFLRRYKSYSVGFDEIDKGQPSLVIMAHLQPEATSFPEAGRTYSHIALASHFRKLCYEGPIYYKEHWASSNYLDGGYHNKLASIPSRVGVNRDTNYCERLINLNCSLFPMNSPMPHEINAVLVTIAGSIAIERALKGYVTIYSGLPWWKGLPGTLHIDELGECFTKIPEDWTKACPKRANHAKLFLLELLNENTLSNEIGIGLTDKIGIQPKFAIEFRSLIKNIIELED